MRGVSRASQSDQDEWYDRSCSGAMAWLAESACRSAAAPGHTIGWWDGTNRIRGCAWRAGAGDWVATPAQLCIAGAGPSVVMATPAMGLSPAESGV
jgi:hypothetical protein